MRAAAPCLATDSHARAALNALADAAPEGHCPERVARLVSGEGEGAAREGLEVTPWLTGAGAALGVVRAAPATAFERALAEARRRWAPTPRQVEVLDLVVDGYRFREIAEALGSSVGTVKVHLRPIRLKLDSPASG